MTTEQQFRSMYELHQPDVHSSRVRDRMDESARSNSSRRRLRSFQLADVAIDRPVHGYVATAQRIAT